MVLGPSLAGRRGLGVRAAVRGGPGVRRCSKGRWRGCQLRLESPRRMQQAAVYRFGAALTLWIVATGCKPKIGDECKTSTDCSVTGDRLCDITQPSGYCTIFNCEEPGSCPD